ncbi:Sua5/YciO/YrdC/YwlC family protein [Luminiphilus syltensis NOR5-1B]|uniref:Sua5/YciO/YrdC/YwlC family protein n=1 Tax=Luminiphilus syltensis NOR5-1B TaxID=565045 RepID=B8KQK0_9GAMM|nr:L-threonylcarbamoyladenylate synthase [Luminiphilus syltensis]EED35484.1 Sua5/YciO/YrdC/YwlC family protein [Luminiphilus syltensis NOR5-1B]
MSQFFAIHPENPQARLVAQAVTIVNKGGVIVYPTDSAYALGCLLGNKSALERIRRIRQLDDSHNFTLVCRDLSELGNYARVDNTAYRLIRAHTPGPFTFILEATREVPKRLQHPKRKTIGLRVPDNAIAQALLAELDAPMMSVTLIMPDDEYPLTDPYDIRDILEHHVDAVIDGGYCGLEPTSVVDMTCDPPEITRRGLGDCSDFDVT